MKKFYKSKVFWFNVLALVVVVAGNFGYTGELPAEWNIFAPVIIAGINFLLRWVTEQKITV